LANRTLRRAAARSGSRAVQRRPAPTRPYEGPANRIVERDKFSREIEIWHANDAGDPRELMFELPKGLRPETVEKAFLFYGRQWIDWLDRQGVQVDPRTIRMAGPAPCLELDKLDREQYFIRALCKRVRPEVRRLDEALDLFEHQPVAGSAMRMLLQTTVAPELIEANARAQAAAAKVAPAMRAHQQQVQDWRRAKGLPLFKEEASDGG